MSNKALALTRNMLRYSVATVGPIGSAVVQFLLSLVLLRALDQTQFGSFSFLLVASQFSWGIWSALLCAPLPILLVTGDPATRAALLRGLFTVNFLGASVAAVAFWVIGSALGGTGGTVVFAFYAGVALLRWFARAHAYAVGRPLRTMASDLVYSGVLLVGVALMVVFHARTLHWAYVALLAGAIVGLLPFGPRFLAREFLRVSVRDIGAYLPVWRQHSGWSLLGVLTTEATANAHAYLVTVLLGPSAFAPIAASALMIRPITVAMNALTEYERAQMARQIAERRIDLARAAVRFFRGVLVLAWIGTAALILVLLAFAPRLIFPRQYDLTMLVTGATLWMAVGGTRLLRVPESAMLQAAGAFRPLAFTTVWSSGASIVAVVVLVLIGGPLWSIAGVLLGEALSTGLTWRLSAAWLRGATARDDADMTKAAAATA